MDVRELREENYFMGDDLDFLEDSYFIRKSGSGIPKIKGRFLTDLYLRKVDEILGR